MLANDNLCINIFKVDVLTFVLVMIMKIMKIMKIMMIMIYLIMI